MDYTVSTTYDVVTGYDLMDLVTIVNDRIKFGWQVQGGLVVLPGRYMQAMIKTNTRR